MILDSIEWWRWRSLVDSIILSTHTNMLFLNWSKKMFNKYSFVSFRDTQSSVLEEILRKLGVEILSKEDVQKMQWEVLEAKIGKDSFHAYCCKYLFGIWTNLAVFMFWIYMYIYIYIEKLHVLNIWLCMNRSNCFMLESR